MNPFRENTALLIAGLVVAGIAAWYLLNLSIETVLGLFGLGGAGIAAKTMQQQKLKTIADEHQDMADHAINQAVIKQKQADEVHRATEALSKGIKQRDEPPAPGKTRKRFSAS